MEVRESDAVDVITDRLEATLPDGLTRGVIEGTVRGVWDELAPDANCTAFLPLLTERIARDRLRRYADDLARTAVYTLGPETMRPVLTQVDPPKSMTSGFYEVSLTMDPPSATAWAAFTATHLHAHVAFIRDDLVLEAPIIEEPVTSGKIALTTQTAQAADQLAQLAGRPE